MDKRLIEAAMKGEVEKLQNLIKHEPFILHTAALEEGDTLLHIACTGSHIDFVKEILILSPELGQEINQSGFTPLHIACARGNVEIVKELLKVGSHLCLVKGREGRIPLHTAVVKGRVGVIRALVSVSSDSIMQVSSRGQTCFHLAVKYSQFEALKVLCELLASFDNGEEILNCRDERGNTVLHLAASTKQYEVFNLLLENNSCFKGVVAVNSLNKKKLTASDILSSEGGDIDIEEILTLAGATTRASSSPDAQVPDQDQSSTALRSEPRTARLKSASQKLQEYFKYDKTRESPSTARNTLLVITVLMVTATYQAVLSPPGGVWQEDYWPDAAVRNNSSISIRPMPRHWAGKSVMGSMNYVAYGLFLLFNSVGFFMSLHMMNFLTLGLPLQFELRVALFALTATYDTCMVAIAPAGKLSTFFIVLSVMMPFIMILLRWLEISTRGGVVNPRCPFHNVDLIYVLIFIFIFILPGY